MRPKPGKAHDEAHRAAVRACNPWPAPIRLATRTAVAASVHGYARRVQRAYAIKTFGSKGQMIQLTLRLCVLAILGLLPAGWQRAPLL
jgi:hypothetical protein